MGRKGVVMILYSSSMFTVPKINGSNYYEWTTSDRRLHKMAAANKEYSESARTALCLANTVCEAGFCSETLCCVSEYGKVSFVVAVLDDERGRLLARFYVGFGDIEILYSLYAEELLLESSSWRAYFGRMMDWYTKPINHALALLAISRGVLKPAEPCLCSGVGRAIQFAVPPQLNYLALI